MTTNLPIASPDKPEKPKRISKRIKAAVEALVHGEARSITDAAQAAGLSREHLSRELGKPHVNEFLRGKVVRNLAINAAKAGATKVKLLDSENGMVADRASSFILGLAGITPETAPAAPPSGQVAGLQIIIVEPSGITAPASRVIGPDPVRQIEHEPDQGHVSR